MEMGVRVCLEVQQAGDKESGAWIRIRIPIGLRGCNGNIEDWRRLARVYCAC